uniref:Uncharacterized protein n=1 Tax=Mycena chlorophos TaxID=658473 RepID=A0ABQ0LJP6_MYCCL|nr:predicted protein [Mycena chlorophos]
MPAEDVVTALAIPELPADDSKKDVYKSADPDKDSVEKVIEKDHVESVNEEEETVAVIDKAEDVAIQIKSNAWGQILSTRDDPELPSITFRSIFLGLGLSAFSAVLATIYTFKARFIGRSSATHY